MGNQPENQSPYRIGSLERALLVVDTLAEVPDASVAELAQLLGVAKGSLFRHLKVLEANGYVLQSPGTKRYSLGRTTKGRITLRPGRARKCFSLSVATVAESENPAAPMRQSRYPTP